MHPAWRNAAALVVALAALNAALTFGNLWPTPWITPLPQLSVELAAVVLLAAWLAAWRGAPSLRRAGALTAFTLAWALGRYAEVTVPGLFGRPLNLYWDAPHLGAVAAMLIEAAAPWRVVLAALSGAAVLAAAYLLLRRAWREVLCALGQPGTRRALSAGAAMVLAAYAAGTSGLSPAAVRAFARPVIATLADQAVFLADAGSAHAAAALPPAPVVASDLARVRDADVYLVFVESYGAVTFDHPDYDAALERSRAELQRAIGAAGLEVLSARVTSPTFGGRSWLAHASLMAGVEVREPRTYDLLLTTERPTLVTLFRSHGYRTVALMPGLRGPWPEGQFWGFETVLGARELDYRGPEFGWWRIPDQYALARLHRDEVMHDGRAPLFVFFPTISSHTPFRPTPPYQPDWTRLLGTEPFDTAALDAALAQEPEWTRLGRAYVDTIAYAYTTLAGYLRLPRPRDAVFVVIGDHQPPGSVTGPGQPWDVPVHVITSRREVLAVLSAAGFVGGMVPAQRAWGAMHAFEALLLAACGEDPAMQSGQAPGIDVAGATTPRHAYQRLAHTRRVDPVRHGKTESLPH